MNSNCLNVGPAGTPRGIVRARRLFVLRTAASTVAMAAATRAWSQSSAQQQQLDIDRAVEKLLPGARPRPGRISIELPEVADNGNTVPCAFSIDSPMTEADHVRELHVWAARNPRPWVLSAQFSPANPRARLETRLRLGESQRIFAIAVMSDGSQWSGHADVIVALSACQDGSG